MLTAGLAALARPARLPLRSCASAMLSSSLAARPSTPTPIPSSRSPRARRLRRAQAAKAAKSPSPSSTSFRDSVSLVASIDELSSNSLAYRIEMPVELLERLTTLVRARSHSQLETLREKHRALTSHTARGAPIDMHSRPVGWTLDKTPQISPYAFGPAETLAYLAYEVEDTYASTHNVLSELKRRLPKFAPTTLLDFGAGPGTASWVSKEIFGDSLDSYRLVEPSQSMVDAALSLLDGFPGLSVRRSVADLTRELSASTGGYDLIVASHVLAELPSDFERVAVTSALWELLADGGCLVLVDSGSPWGSHQVRSARQFVLDMVADEDEDEEDDEDNNKGREGVRVVAPCPHQHECPMGGSTWCHFVQRAPKVQLPRVATAKRWHGQKGVKFSYVVLQKTSGAQQQEKSKLARLVRSPLLATRHVHLDLCTPEGEIERRSVTRGKSIREVYRAARKAHWGASWPADASIYKKDA